MDDIREEERKEFEVIQKKIFLLCSEFWSSIKSTNTVTLLEICEKGKKERKMNHRCHKQ